MSDENNPPPLTPDQVAYAWSVLEEQVQAAVTNRLNKFHDALVKRGQIAEAPVSDQVESDPQPWGSVH